MKAKIEDSLREIICNLYSKNVSNINDISINLQENKEKAHGDLASNIAMVLAKPLGKSPIEIAKQIIDQYEIDKEIINVEIAGPGFINFFLSKDSISEVLREIDQKKQHFGKKVSCEQKVLIEYVSSNPTGPLHVGHGRGAAFGSVLSDLLREAGYEVDEEYYVNDFGRQIDILALSLWVRYAQLYDKNIQMFSDGYQGEYLIEIAENLKRNKADAFFIKDKDIHSLFNSDKDKGENFVDTLVEKIKVNLGKGYSQIKEFAVQEILKLIKSDLTEFGVNHNSWFSESSLYTEDRHSEFRVKKSIEELKAGGFVYEKDNAIWFKSSKFNDDKDRVLKRGSGDFTYFASDVAYHIDKYERGYEKILNIWGSDHHGYLPRVKAALEACNKDRDKLEVVFVQFASLVRSGKKVSMSTRSGEFISIKELMDEVTPDAARFFYINRKADQHLEFDLDLAKEQSKDNPLYYIQYAHARICSVFRKSKIGEDSLSEADLNLLDSERETEIIKSLGQYPKIIERAANSYEPHLICYFLRELSASFHGYYNNEKFLIEDEDLMKSRLFLLKGIKQVIQNGLRVLGQRAPEEM